MPKFLEAILKKKAAEKGFTGEDADRYIYGGMNNLGAMHGSQETAKGKAMEAKHEEDYGRSENDASHARLDTALKSGNENRGNAPPAQLPATGRYLDARIKASTMPDHKPIEDYSVRKQRPLGTNPDGGAAAHPDIRGQGTAEETGGPNKLWMPSTKARRRTKAVPTDGQNSGVSFFLDGSARGGY